MTNRKIILKNLFESQKLNQHSLFAVAQYNTCCMSKSLVLQQSVHCSSSILHIYDCFLQSRRSYLRGSKVPYEWKIPLFLFPFPTRSLLPVYMKYSVHSIVAHPHGTPVAPAPVLISRSGCWEELEAVQPELLSFPFLTMLARPRGCPLKRTSLCISGRSSDKHISVSQLELRKARQQML